MGGGKTDNPSGRPGPVRVEPGLIADAYAPVVRGFALAASIYYVIITFSHPAFEKGVDLVVLSGLSAVAALVAFVAWRTLRVRKLSLPALEALTAAVWVCFLLNIVAYHALHFDERRLVYFVLLALVCGTTAPTQRLATLGVAACLASFLAFCLARGPLFMADHAFIGLAGGFASLGITTLMRGAVTREISARVASEALARDAAAASSAKSAFLATMSHEIRTPLNGVLGMAQGMAQGPLPADQRERLEVIQDSAGSLLTILNDVLDMAQIESGRLEIRPAPFHIGEFADGLRRLYGPLAEAKGLAFRLDVEAGTCDGRLGDAARLRQIVSNLVSNALKFTAAGEVTVRLVALGGRLVVDVTDTGGGVPPEVQARIFDRFVQADDGATRRVGGTGLGLSICHELAELMGGEITFRSEAGRGSSFTLNAPLPEARLEATQRGEAPTAVALRRALVVDDNPTNLLVLGMLLDGLGVPHAAATSAEEAIEAFHRERWDLVLMDVHMPGMSGLDATRAIRRAESALGRRRTPIIAVTASVLPEETRAYREAGMDGVVAKPIQLPTLIACIESLGEDAIAREAVA